jgi:hypothetical protein
MVGELVEAADRWLVPMAGLTVTQCRLDYAFSVVVADEPAGSFEVRIEQPFTVASRGDELTIDPEGDPVQMAPALRVLRQEVEQAIAFKDGRLELTFGDGVLLRVPVGEDYEAWKIVGPAGLRIVSLPGGELAIWSPERDDDTSVG